jgi:FeS assembly SUF system protein
MDLPPRRLPLDTVPPQPSSEGPSAAEPTAAEPPTVPAPEDHRPPLTAEQREELRQQVLAVLSSCYDPEIPINIYELGLIYGLDITPTGDVQVRMTLTTPGCPVAVSLPAEVRSKLQALPQVRSVHVEVVWDPPWTPARMSEAARLQLGLEDW